MNELIKVNWDAEQPSVSARELHKGLEIGTEFAKWFSRMCEYGFSDENDYSEVIVKNDENLKGGRPATDYNISVDMAKQICMIQRTERERKTVSPSQGLSDICSELFLKDFSYGLWTQIP